MARIDLTSARFLARISVGTTALAAIATVALADTSRAVRPGSSDDRSRLEILQLIADTLQKNAPLSADRQQGGVADANSFVNWESPHVHPLDLTPDHTRLLAVNTADNRLEVFDVTGVTPVLSTSIPVGLDPVSVRARSNDEAWVANHVSDSVSIVNLTSGAVTATLTVGDEPCDVVFAGTPQRAFVTISQLNQVKVFDPSNLALPPTTLAIAGEDPRALATDGTRVYAAIFESGNRTTILSQATVSSAANPYPGDPNPPPNAGTAFNPPVGAGLPTPPSVGLILKKDAAGKWRDDNNGDWSGSVNWNLADNDVAIIDAQTLAISYANGLMNLPMALAVGPLGQISVVGTEATNQVRFEPNVNGTFVRTMLARFQPTTPAVTTIVDLNPHLTYSTPTLPQASRDLSLGDPRQIVWNSIGSTGYVAGMGSNNVVVIDPLGTPLARVPVGAGPTGLALNDATNTLYVLDRFDASISVINVNTNTESQRIPFFDPTPATIRAGRPFLYDTHRTSGLGQASCASCHVDARMDQLAWDLGDPAGAVKPFEEVCNFGLAGGCEDWHPMKGPMTTQSLIGITGTEPLHWRGDRSGLDQFNPAFVSLLGDDAQLTPDEMDAFEAFIATLKVGPNPNRNLDNSLKTSLPGSGNPANGQTLFLNTPFDGGILRCNTCHAVPDGTNGQLTSGNLLQQTQSMKIPQLRNMYEKMGFSKTSSTATRGFGFVHDGSVANLLEFLTTPVFNFAPGAAGQQQKKDLEAFMFSFATDTHAGVGVQSTLVSLSTATAAQIALLDQMQTIANGGAVQLVAKGRVGGIARGWRSLGGGNWQSDRLAETLTSAQLRALAAPSSEITYTLVPAGTGIRIGLDRDEDGYFDRDEIDAGSNPADPSSVPGACLADLDGDGTVLANDLAVLLGAWGPCAGCAADLDGSGDVDAIDLSVLLGAWGCGT
ncbi:MAG: hypothetical protein SGJ09_05530 [Phycisphaerae bacterium]|nr:hypothetical protein [Phycisphaerae bacterium]